MHRFHGSLRAAALVAATLFSLVGQTGLITAHANYTTATSVGFVGGPGHAGLYGWGATTMLDGSVLIGDYWNNRVIHYAKDGTSLGVFVKTTSPMFTRNYSPYGMAVDPNDGSVYISDTNSWRIEKYDALGNWLYTIGSKGTAPGQFMYPSRMAVRSNGELWVADAWTAQINVFDSAGTFLFRFGSLGAGPGQFREPHGVGFDALGRFWVVDTNNYRVQIFDPTTSPTPTWLATFGGKGVAPEYFTGELRGLAMDNVNGWVYIVDSAGFVDKFAQSDESFLLRWGKVGTGDGEFINGGREDTVDGDGNLWVGDMPNFRVQKFDSNGNYILQEPNPAAPPVLGGFNGPRGIAFDATGDVFVSDTYNQRIEKFDPTYAPLLQWGSRDNGKFGFNYPRLMAIDPADQGVVVADTDNNRVKKFDNNGNLIWQIGGYGSKTKPVQFFDPYSVDVGADSTIYVADGNNGRIVVLNPGTAIVPPTFRFTFGTKGTGPGQFKQLRGVHVDADGTIWTTDALRAVIQHFAADGTYLGTVGSKGTGPGQLTQPFGITTDANNVYVTDAPVGLVDVYQKSDAAFLFSFGGPGHAAGKLALPQGIGFGPNGHLYVVEQRNDRVQEWSLS